MATLRGLQEVARMLQERADKAAMQASMQTGNDTEKKVREAAQKAVTRWYGDYDPAFYSRTDALKDFEVSHDGEGYFVDFSQQIATHQSNNDYILELVVAQGFHGGSQGVDHTGMEARSPRYRAPVPYYAHWSRRAGSSEPIIKEIDAKIDELNKRVPADTLKIFQQKFMSG